MWLFFQSHSWDVKMFFKALGFNTLLSVIHTELYDI